MLFVLVWGRRLYGRVDAVPGLFHVATLFFHFMYIPLFSQGSFIVLDAPVATANVVPFVDWGFYGVPIPSSWKSILLAWFRVILFPFGVFGGLVLLLSARGGFAAEERLQVLAFGAAFVVWLALLIVPRRIRPGYDRARELGEAVGLDPEGWALLNSQYGR